jgi:putative hemolysin
LDSDSTITIIFLALGVGVFLGLHSAEAALPLLRRVYLREALPERGLREAAVRNLRTGRHKYEDLIRVLRLTSIAAIFALGLAFFWVQMEFAWPFTLLGMAGLWMGLLLLRPLAVKAVERLSNSLLMWAAVPIQFLLWPVLPLVQFSSRTMQAARRVVDHPAGNGIATQAEQRLEEEAPVEEEIAEEPLEPEERRMIYAILHMEDTAIREIVVPRVDVVAVEVLTPLDEATSRMLKSGHSRMPVYKETLDNVVGVLYSRDLLEAATSNGDQTATLEKLLRKPFFIPESKRVDELLREFQAMRVHMAIVVDEYGGVAGIVTIEDLIEEIVGEIEDEFDTSNPTIEQDEEGRPLVDARIEVDAFNARFNVDIAGEGFETLGGFLYSQLGKIPSPGDLVTASGLQMEVVTTVGRRIKKVRVSESPSIHPHKGADAHKADS